MDRYLTGLFMTDASHGVPFDDFVFRLLVAFLVGQLIGWAYRTAHLGLSYSQGFVQSLVLLAMVTCVVMTIVGDSLARAFGLGAALAIVRFRTPVKDARDTVFLFLSVASGMAAGSGQVGVAAVAGIGVSAVAIHLKRVSFGARSDKDGLLRLRLGGTADDRRLLDEVLARHCAEVQLTAVRVLEGAQDLAFELGLRDNDGADALIRDLRSLTTVSGVTLLAHARSGDGQ